jgi:hypothetical protein
VPRCVSSLAREGRIARAATELQAVVGNRVAKAATSPRPKHARGQPNRPLVCRRIEGPRDCRSIGEAGRSGLVRDAASCGARKLWRGAGNSECATGCSLKSLASGRGKGTHFLNRRSPGGESAHFSSFAPGNWPRGRGAPAGGLFRDQRRSCQRQRALTNRSSRGTPRTRTCTPSASSRSFRRTWGSPS